MIVLAQATRRKTKNISATSDEKMPNLGPFMTLCCKFKHCPPLNETAGIFFSHNDRFTTYTFMHTLQMKCDARIPRGLARQGIEKRSGAILVLLQHRIGLAITVYISARIVRLKRLPNLNSGGLALQNNQSRGTKPDAGAKHLCRLAH